MLWVREFDTTEVYRYTPNSTVHRTLILGNGDRLLEATKEDGSEISGSRKDNVMDGDSVENNVELCQPGSVQSVSSTIVGTHLQRRPLSWRL